MRRPEIFRGIVKLMIISDEKRAVVEIEDRLIERSLGLK